jgi:chromosome segregation ATPase
MIRDLEGKKEQQKEKFDSRQADYIKEKDEPVRLGKGNENLRIAVDHLKNDLANLKRETEQHEKSKEKEDKIAEELAQKSGTTQEDIKIKDKLIQNIGIEIQRNNTASVAIGNEIANIHADRTNVDTEISQLTQTQKRLTKTLNRLKLDIDKQLKEKKKAETEYKGIESYNKEQKT